MDILPKCIVYCDLREIGVLMFVGYQHMYLHAFACPGSNNVLKLFLRLRIVYIIHPQKILEFHIKDGISCFSVILGDCTLQGLLEKSGSLTHDARQPATIF